MLLLEAFTKTWRESGRKGSSNCKQELKVRIRKMTTLLDQFIRFYEAFEQDAASEAEFSDLPGLSRLWQPGLEDEDSSPPESAAPLGLDPDLGLNQPGGLHNVNNVNNVAAGSEPVGHDIDRATGSTRQDAVASQEDTKGFVAQQGSNEPKDTGRAGLEAINPRSAEHGLRTARKAPGGAAPQHPHDPTSEKVLATGRNIYQVRGTFPQYRNHLLAAREILMGAWAPGVVSHFV